MTRDPDVRGDLWRCEECGGWMSRVVPQGLHAVRVIDGTPRNCAGRVIPREELKP